MRRRLRAAWQAAFVEGLEGAPQPLVHVAGAGYRARWLAQQTGAAIELLLAALEQRHAIACDVVLLNAGAALYVAGLADDLRVGIALAREVIASGAARARVDAFVAATQKLAETAA